MSKPYLVHILAYCCIIGSGACSQFEFDALDGFDELVLGPLDFASLEDEAPLDPQIAQPEPRTWTDNEISVLKILFGSQHWDDPQREVDRRLPAHLLTFLDTIQKKSPCSINDLLLALPEDNPPANRASITRFLTKYTQLGWVNRNEGKIALGAKGVFALAQLHPHKQALEAPSKKRPREKDSDEAVDPLKGLKKTDKYAFLLEAINASNRPLTREQIKRITWGKGPKSKNLSQNLQVLLTRGWIERDSEAQTYTITTKGREALPRLNSQQSNVDGPDATKKQRQIKLIEVNIRTLRKKHIFLDLLDLMNEPEEYHSCPEYLARLGAKKAEHDIRDLTYNQAYFPKLEEFGWVTMERRGRANTYAITPLGLEKREELRLIVESMEVDQ